MRTLTIHIAAAAALAVSLAVAQTDADASKERRAALQRELLALMDERIGLARERVETLEQGFDENLEAARAGLRDQATVDAAQQALLEAQIRVAELRLEQARLLDRIAPQDSPRFDAMLASAGQQEQLGRLAVELAERGLTRTRALHQAAACAAIDVTRAEKALLDRRLAVVAATQLRKDIELQKLEFAAARKRDREAPESP